MAEKKANIEKIESTLMEVERAYTSSPNTSVVLGAYALYIAHNTPELIELKDILEENKVSPFLRETIIEYIGGHWEEYRHLLTMFSQFELEQYFKNRVNGERLCKSGRKNGLSSSMPVVEHVANILNIKQGESVCDLGCSVGDFVYRASLNNASRIVGYEITKDFAAIAQARMRTVCRDADVDIKHFDIFAKDTWEETFDKVFCEPPFGVRGLLESEGVGEFIEDKLFRNFPTLSRSMAGDWLFAARAVAAMKDDGRAVVILPPSAMSGIASTPYRRYFIQRNLIEAVVELPERIFEHSAVSASLVIFKKGSKSIKMVSAGALYEKGRRNNVITREYIDIVMQALGFADVDDGKDISRYVKEVDNRELIDCDLSVKKLFADSVTFTKSDKFGNFVKSAKAKRGATIPSDELDDLACDSETDCLYVAPGNISDGVIDSNLMNLKEIPEKYKSYCAKTGDIVVSRVSASGAGFKVAVVEAADDKLVLPNGNLLVISIDKGRADPYFIKACLDSDYAQRYLQNFSAGSAVVTLNYKNLENLPIPEMPLERQGEIANACRNYARSVAELREKLACAKKALGNVLSEIAPEYLNPTI
ncbi:MAG: N-6 DNA methylase [Kiritimatiellae bacterium]|nr:N-6 DNA methylase [Kiritimatiellia bacterium]